MSKELPKFKYFPRPLENGCIIHKEEICECCYLPRRYMYVGPIYCEDEIEEVCPWCIANGMAAAKWSASFNSVYNDVPNGVPKHVLDIIVERTPGYETWQENHWLYSETDALIFIGEVSGAKLISEGNHDKIQACMNALNEWKFDWTIEHLKEVVIGGQPAIYLFQDDRTGKHRAYADMT